MALIGLDVDDIGEPDPVRRGGDEVPTEQVRGKDMFIPVVAHQRRADVRSAPQFGGVAVTHSIYCLRSHRNR